MHRSPLVLGELHLDLLYETDDAGLLLRPRDPAIAAPFFHLVCTAAGNVWLLSAALSEQQREQLQKALISEPVITNLRELESSPPVLTGVRSLLEAEHTPLREERGPTFLFGNVMPLPMGSAEILQEYRNLSTIPELAWIREVTPVERPLSVACNSLGEIVAVCHSARSTAEAAEAGVETASAYRRRGLAGDVVLNWAATVQAEGRLPFYSTNWTNHASRAVACKLGLILYGEDYQIG